MEIVVLSPLADERCTAATVGWPLSKLHPWRRPGNGIRYASIGAFKGLEAKAVIVTDISDVRTPAAQALLYVALSRSQGKLVLLVVEKARTALAELLASNAIRNAAAAPR